MDLFKNRFKHLVLEFNNAFLWKKETTMSESSSHNARQEVWKLINETCKYDPDIYHDVFMLVLDVSASMSGESSEQETIVASEESSFSFLRFFSFRLLIIKTSSSKVGVRCSKCDSSKKALK